VVSVTSRSCGLCGDTMTESTSGADGEMVDGKLVPPPPPPLALTRQRSRSMSPPPGHKMEEIDQGYYSDGGKDAWDEEASGDEEAVPQDESELEASEETKQSTKKKKKKKKKKVRSDQ